jgi:hypothetical protein
VNKSILSFIIVASSLLCLPQHLVGQELDAPANDEVVQKVKFARLKSKEKKSMMTALRLIEKGVINVEDNINEVSDGVTLLISVGEGAIPKCLTSFQRMAKTDRQLYLTVALDSLLMDDDLHIALDLCNKKTPAEVYTYLMSRWADSTRDDSSEVLSFHFKVDSKEVQYHCVRGLLKRGDESVVTACIQIIDTQWKDSKQQLRKDFSGMSRGIMSSAIEEKMTTPNKKVRLLSLHLFELFGLKDNANILADNLSNSDTALRLGAINACRVVVAGEEPLLRPSMTELIELANDWLTKI